MASADRQLIMETNRSIRNIKTELEKLLENGVIDEGVFDEIHTSLPQESPLSGPLRTATGTSSVSSPAPARAAATSPTPPTQGLNNLNLNNGAAASSQASLPSYEDTPAPSLPQRNQPTPGAPPAKPTLANARALYKYVASDARDVSFEKDDRVAVLEYMNQDWWMGRNLRTGQEGIFPRNYVLVESEEKRGFPGAAPQQPTYGYPPAQQNPYNSNVPPMAVAGEGGDQAQAQAQGGGNEKVNAGAKKFGKKLGNAAIFGAGATIGSNIVNSIF